MSGLKYFFSTLITILIALTLTNHTVFAEVIYLTDNENKIPEEHYSKGEAYLDAGQFDETIMEFTQAIEMNNNPKYYVARGKAYLHMGSFISKRAKIVEIMNLPQEDYVFAKKDFDKAIQIDENYAEAYIYRQMYYLFQNEIELAKDNLMIAGEKFLQQKDFDTASEVYRTVITFDSDCAYAYYQLGLVYYEQRKYSDAVHEFNRAIFLFKDSDEAKAYNMRGYSYYQLKEYDKAIGDFSKAIEINASQAEYYENRAMAYYDFKQYQNALNDFNELIKFDEKSKEFYKQEIEKCQSELKVVYLNEFWKEHGETVLFILCATFFIIMIFYDGRLKIAYEQSIGTLTHHIKNQIIFQGVVWLIVFMAFSILINTFTASISGVVIASLLGSAYLLFKSIIPNYAKLHNFTLPEGFLDVVKIILDKYLNKS